MEPDSYVWCTDPDEAWILAKVVDKMDEKIQLCRVVQKGDDAVNGDVSTATLFSRAKHNGDNAFPASTTTKYVGVELANSAPTNVDIHGSSERCWQRCDENLITLPHLHEPAILQVISERFMNGQIYTWTGPVLIAVNPFRHLPIYNEEFLEQYRTQCAVTSNADHRQGGNSTAVVPHIYAVADRSFRQMMTDRKSQSLLISGESGAGKTESTKIVMKYLTTVGSSGNFSASAKSSVQNMTIKQKQPPSNNIMDRVLQSNPILEAFGNAQTLRNANSSRFGKFIKLGFDAHGHLLGANVQTYLLERVRLASHAAGERNYHIFYQLLRGGTKEQLQKFALIDQYGATQADDLPSIFRCTNQGGAPHLQQECVDGGEFQEVLKAMKGLGWSEEKIDNVLSLVAGLLHLNQIQYRSVEQGGIKVAVVDSIACLKNSAHFLGVDPDQLEIALTERTNVIRGEEIRSSLSVDSAADARDALAKTLYGALFLWLVGEINKSITWKHDKEVHSSCGVLDIFGFECFATNSFEQLCINFANEALQQQFNKFVFELEQAKYKEEGIDWTFISFPNNQDCLDLIQRKKTGILAILDDELKLPMACDKNFAGRMFKQLLPEKSQTESNNKCFSATRFQKSRSIFCVRHFAGHVQYSAETGFVEKNRDEIPATAKSLFQTAPSKLIQSIFDAMEYRNESLRPPPSVSTPSKRGVASKSANTVGMQFKKQLDKLLLDVQKTDPHYIRCLKPNDEANPHILARTRLAEQLRCGGVLEAVRVARMGYPVQIDHAAFLEQFWSFIPFCARGARPCNETESNSNRLLCGKILDKLRGHFVCESQLYSKKQALFCDKTDIQIGLTKVFIRHTLHEELEALRATSQHTSAARIQARAKGVQHRARHRMLIDGTLTIQRLFRGWSERKSLQLCRSATAGALLVKNYRMFLNRRRFRRAKSGIKNLQILFRIKCASRNVAVTKIQANLRMYVVRKTYRTFRVSIISLQRVLRKCIACSKLEQSASEYDEIKRLREDSRKIQGHLEDVKSALQKEKERADRLQDMISKGWRLPMSEQKLFLPCSRNNEEINRKTKCFNHGSIANYVRYLQREEDKKREKLCIVTSCKDDSQEEELGRENHYNETRCESPNESHYQEPGQKEKHCETGENNAVKVHGHNQKDIFVQTDRNRVIIMGFMFLILFVLVVTITCLMAVLRRRSATRVLLFALELYSEAGNEAWDDVSVALANLAA